MNKIGYIDLKYKPGDDLICLFRIEPNKISVKEAAGIVALESSIGTWVEVKTKKDYVNRLAAKVFSIKGNYAKIAYPSELFERGNVPNILSSVAGNIFGMKAVNNLRLEDISIPKSILKGFKGPHFGIDGIRSKMKIYNRPLLGTIIKPKLGLNSRDHARVAYEAWIGGCDITKDDENLSSQRFNKFEERLSKTLEMADKAEEETGEKKAYLVNITAETNEMIRRAELVEKQGGKYIMVDIITEGFGALQTLREANFNLIIHAHRAMAAAFTRNKKHGINFLVIAKLARLIGTDQIHIGTGIGKLEGNIKEIIDVKEDIEKNNIKENIDIERDDIKENVLVLKQDWLNMNPTLAVCSGGLNPLHIPFLIKNMGKNIVIQMGGGIHGNNLGTIGGARAARQAIDAALKGIGLKEYAKNHVELKSTIEQWGSVKF